MRLVLLVMIPILVAGLAGTLFTLVHRESDPGFTFAEENPARLDRGQVERAIATAPEPVEENVRTPERTTRCRPEGAGDLRNPWICNVRYRSRKRYRYYVTVEKDGRFSGRLARRGRIVFDGCCITVPRPRA